MIIRDLYNNIDFPMMTVKVNDGNLKCVWEGRFDLLDEKFLDREVESFGVYDNRLVIRIVQRFNILPIDLQSGTVKDWIDFLTQLPQDYEISMMGNTANMDLTTLIDNKNKSILFDEENYISELVANYEEEGEC